MAGVLIFGATRGTGLEVARALSARAVPVVAAVRASSDTSALDTLGAATVVADIFDPGDVAALIADSKPVAIVLSLSGQKGEQRRADREGVINIADTAAAAGVHRVVMVTAIGCGDSRAAVAPKVIEVLGEVLAAKTVAEEHLLRVCTPATIVRPGGLTDDPATGTAMLTEDQMTMGVINRADLGHLVADCVTDPAAGGKIYHAVDPEITWQAPLQRGEDVS